MGIKLQAHNDLFYFREREKENSGFPWFNCYFEIQILFNFNLDLPPFSEAMFSFVTLLGAFFFLFFCCHIGTHSICSLTPMLL